MNPGNITFAASALLLIGLAIPLVLRRVRPNGVYGYRTPATLKDQRLWYEVNAKSGVDLLIVGIGLLGLSLANIVGALRDQTFTLVAIAWLAAGVFASMIHGALIIGRYRS